ncbi:MAG: D-alanyl-D-alanine carboxypeptidase [Bacteroidaceae bacterium]|nr:D-alanyl-D-alanine carboxypeptidase [Bacteroidaceae bacterium]
MGTSPPTKKKRRRLKKSVRRGCLGIVLTAVLFIVLSVYECRRDTRQAGIPVVVQPDSLPDGRDSVLARRLARVVARTPRIDSSRVGLMVYDLTHRSEIFRHHSEELMTPASCQKLLTALSTIRRLGIEHSYVSRLLINGEETDSTLVGTVIVDMDDDPLIDSFDGFVNALWRRGIRRIEGNIVFDLARRDTLRPHPTAPSWDIPYGKLPLLMRGEPFVRRQFMDALAAKGIRFQRNTDICILWEQKLGTPCSPQEYALARQLAGVLSREVHCVIHPLRNVLAPMLIYSSNIKAEAVYYHADHFRDRWRNGRTKEGSAMRRFVKNEIKGVVRPDMVINDGSGLSPQNRLTADFLIKLLKYAYDDPLLREEMMDCLLATTADDERRGTLYGRMEDECFTGRIFCKTGTLAARAVSSLAGYLQGEDNRWYAFVIFNEDTPIFEARLFQDEVCRVLISQ